MVDLSVKCGVKGNMSRKVPNSPGTEKSSKKGNGREAFPAASRGVPYETGILEENVPWQLPNTQERYMG
jgi:hypothetical protein